MNIDQLFAQLNKDRAESIYIPASWGQGRTAYGGISAALIYEAFKGHLQDGRLLRSLYITFVGPVLLDEALDIEVSFLREGKNVTQLQGRMLQKGAVVVQAQASFGLDMPSAITVANNDKHYLQKPDKVPQLVDSQLPAFLQHIDIRLLEGDLPFSGSSYSSLGGWMRYVDTPQCLTDSHLLALIDAWPPATLQMAADVAPASSLSWNIEFIYPHKAFRPDEWFAYRAHTRQAAGGYGHTEANIWDEDGELVALSRQTVMVFDS